MTNLFSHESYDDHEQVIFVSDEACGLKGIIGIHNTALGPAAGGCRMYPYNSVDTALNDVLRLSRGMTMKNAAANLPLGGGKCIIIGDPLEKGKEDKLKAMARHVQRLAGTYWTAIDVGVSATDADLMAEECDYIFARASEFSADFPPAHFTSIGGFHAIRAVASHIRGSDNLQGLRVAVQGVGQTGADLIGQLVEQGVEVIAADVNEQALTDVVKRFQIKTVAPETIHTQHVDIFAPCAMGGVLNDKTIAELKCTGIAGLANNQLEHPGNGRHLLERKIAYAPDFVANAGGMMGASMPIFTTPDKEKSLKHIATIYDSLIEILQRSQDEDIPTESIAEEIALNRIHQKT